MPVPAAASATGADGIGAVVVSYRSAETIDDCLRRLRACTGVVAIRVVDNHSDDGTVEIVQRHAAADPRVRFIANPDNPGFAVGCNQGVAALEGVADGLGWIALVNPDCLLEPGQLAQLRELVAPHRPALLGADLVDESGQRDAAARRRDPDFGAMLADLARGSTAAAALAIARVPEQSLQPVPAVSGALMLVSRGLYARIGGFDEGYRLHAEDLDLCRRARDAGGFVAVANAVQVVHVRGVSSRSRPVFVEWHKHRGLWRYFRKFESAQRSGAVRAGVFAMIWLRFPIAALRGLLAR